MTMKKLANRALEEKNFCPLITQSSPSRVAVGAALRLGHREAGDDVARQQRLQVPGLLLVGAEVGEDLRVAGVRRLGAEDARAPDRLAKDLVQHRELELAVALAAELGAEVAGPQALLAYLVLERLDDVALLVGEVFGGLVVVVRPERVDLVDLVGDEAVGPVEFLLELGLGSEVPGHF
jgi:hypothetical protein